MVVILQQVSPFPWNYCEFGPYPHGVTMKSVPISLLPWSNRGYYRITMITVPVQFSTANIC